MTVFSTILTAYKTSKYGSKASNCADSFAISPDGLKIAIADGVSKSYMPKFVADALTEYYVSDKHAGGTLFNGDNATELLSDVVKEWSRKAHDFEASVDEDTAYDLQYQRELYGMGASTFAGICIGPETFAFDVLGDSCIFLIPKDRSISPLILSSMPCEVNFDRDTPFNCDFGIHPHFIDTKGRIVGEPFEDSIKALDCTILLATDAFSDWFCRHYTKGDCNHIIDSLKEIDSQEKFDSFIDNLRDNDLKNDDVAIVLVDVRLIENESILFSTDKNGVTYVTTSENNDGKSTFDSADGSESDIENPNNLDVKSPTKDGLNTDKLIDVENSDSDELNPDVNRNNTVEIATEELPVSGMSENIQESKPENLNYNNVGDEDDIADLTEEKMDRKSKII